MNSTMHMNVYSFEKKIDLVTRTQIPLEGVCVSLYADVQGKFINLELLIPIISVYSSIEWASEIFVGSQ